MSDNLQKAPTTTTSKTARPPRILAHYMPWFMARPFSTIWGWHWTMGTFHPDQKQPNGRASIASHYTPLIGAYDSGDPDVLEYHCLLMRLAGIDGVVIDWYGTTDYLDYALNHRNSTAFVEQARKIRLEFAICYEDQTIPKLVQAGRLDPKKRLSHAQKEIDWLQSHWFDDPLYLKMADRPVLLSFGHEGLSDQEWEMLLKRAQVHTRLPERA